MNIQRARVAGVICFPDFFEQRFALYDFAVFIHQNVKQGDQAGGQLGAFPEASYPAVFDIETDRTYADKIVAVTGHERLDPVYQFLRGEREGKHGVGEVFVDRFLFCQDEDDRDFLIFLAQRKANAHACASQGGGVDDNYDRIDLFELGCGLTSILKGTNIKSLLLQVVCKRRDLCISSFDHEKCRFFHWNKSDDNFKRMG